MNRGWLCTAALAAAGLVPWCTPASAQVGGPLVGGPVPVYGGESEAVYIPPPPSVEPNFQLGLRYWHSEGKTRFDIDSSRLAPDFYGSPTSTLDYDGMQGDTIEFTFRAANETDTIFKGFVGGGWIDGGSLDDEDYFAGQVKFSDTYSSIDGDGMLYGTLDLAKRFNIATGGPELQINPLIGFNYWQETADAYGVRCNPDQVGGIYCGPPGSVAVPFGTKVITNEVHWASLRLGAEVKVKFLDRITLIGDAAFLPVAYLWNDDSHHLRRDLGPTPNIKDSGTGWGYQLEGSAQIDINENWAISSGVRYWYAKTDGDSEFVHTGTTVDLQDFTSERIGVFGDVTYRFSTF
ncbi:hypothetical protein V6C03_12760 [Methyloligella sp. 2.7D]|uniref:hypothetical protein n=1 Tax=unclassified Methyloligella TaxID=2625955 RepID=UPI00157C2EAF|nr:hypothetical protein [Methyloligella sp. GL2]QKP77347.1 hypothetical protein HT051_07700 [Methyloligella sp. GL2]